MTLRLNAQKCATNRQTDGMKWWRMKKHTRYELKMSDRGYAYLFG